MNKPVFSIVGKSGAGKTTLIEKLVPALKAKGLRVGTIKHDAHRFDIDREGKDSYRHFSAGSDTVVIASSEKLALVKRLEAPMPIDEIVERYFSDADIVLTEGYKKGDKPKIEAHRKDMANELLCGPEDKLIAVVTDEKINLQCPQFQWSEIDKLADFVIEQCPKSK